MLEKLLSLDTQLFVFLNGLGSTTYDGLWLFITKQSNWIPLFLLLLYVIYKKLGAKQTLYLLLFIVLPFKYALGTFVILHFLRFYLQANKSYSIKITEYFEIFFLTLALDTGRLIGSIRGLIYRHKVKDVQD